MTEIAFLLNGTPVRVADQPPTRTLLDWLREDRGLTGTKEGCNEGDCGACTVMVTDADGAKALNACILFLPQLHGKAIRTIEGIVGPKGELHPVQEAMITHHGSQCGFCTPGFIVSMATAHLNGATDHDDQLAGNLCRCTGYAPIIRAAEVAADRPVPIWMKTDAGFLSAHVSSGVRGQTAPGAFQPRDSDELAHWYLANPDATLIAGATDVGLWVTKQLRDLAPIAFLNGVTDLQHIEQSGGQLHIGAGVTITALLEAMRPLHPSFAELLRRYSSVQVRNAATIGGNIANGSPIGDGAPVLIALGAQIVLRRGDQQRTLALQDFYLDYLKNQLLPGEFVRALRVPLPQPGEMLRVYKLSKRHDSDISGLAAGLWLRIDGDTVADLRWAFGGMAAIVKRATGAEAAVRGQRWSEATLQAACAALDADFSPLSDLRASASYRRRAARGLLRRLWLETRSDAPLAALATSVWSL